MKILVFCPKCAWILIGDSNDGIKLCGECGTVLVKTNIPKSEDPPVTSKEYLVLRRKIYKEQIEPMGKLDKSLSSYKYFYTDYFGTEEEKAELNARRQAESKRKIQENMPHCPVCNSTKLQKISTGSKVGSAALFGVFSIGHIGKTFRCLNCGFKF